MGCIIDREKAYNLEDFPFNAKSALVVIGPLAKEQNTQRHIEQAPKIIGLSGSGQSGTTPGNCKQLQKVGFKDIEVNLCFQKILEATEGGDVSVVVGSKPFVAKKAKKKKIQGFEVVGEICKPSTKK